MIYYKNGSSTHNLSHDDLREGLYEALQKLGERRKILAIPPDYTRLPSRAGELTEMAWEYYGEQLTDVLPALGTHTPMTDMQIAGMFGNTPPSLFREHDWRNDVVTLGQVPADYVSEVTDGQVNFTWPAQVNKLLINGDFDLILSIGQVVPHEVVGMANYNKNIFVGVGGTEAINKSHFVGAVYGMERMMGRADTPVRKIFNYASEHFAKDLPIVYILTVVGVNNAGQQQTYGLFIGDDFEVFNEAAKLSLEVNFKMVEKPLKKVVVWLDPTEFKSTWLGNKSIYRTRMAIADGGELIVLAPTLQEFGEDKEIDRLIRKYGYLGTPHTLQAIVENEDLRDNLSAAAHLIHGSSEGRFSVTYCPGKGAENLSKEEIESVGFRYADIGETMEKYNFQNLKEGFNVMPDGEEIYYISSPALGLWAHRDRFNTKIKTKNKESMKKTILFLFAMMIVISSSAQEPKWQNLFNGKNFRGWTKLNGIAEYKIKNNEIIGISKMNTPNTFMATDKMYDDFILEFDFKVDDGLNSGVQFRSNSLKDYQNGRVHGYQFEIDPSERAWTGGIYDEARRGWLYPVTYNPIGQRAFKNNQWNKARIEAIGNSIRTWVNGVPVSDLLDDVTKSGFIALQVHSINNQELEGKTVSWRNIRILTEDLDKFKTRGNIDGIEQMNTIANTISEREAREGWKLLWDGKTTNGWRGAKLDGFPDKGWSMENGMLKVHKSDGGESTNGGDIVTTRPYKNFMLKVDFKITEGANSGIKYFVDTNLNKGEGSAIGCEYQILDDRNHPDAKLGVAGNRTLGSLYDLIAAPADKPFRSGFFNTAMVVVKGNHVEHWLNGVKIVEYERNTQMWDALVDYSKYIDWPNFGNAEEGLLLLQDHGDEVWFQNIKIKELD